MNCPRPRPFWSQRCDIFADMLLSVRIATSNTVKTVNITRKLNYRLLRNCNFKIGLKVDCVAIAIRALAKVVLYTSTGSSQ